MKSCVSDELVPSFSDFNSTAFDFGDLTVNNVYLCCEQSPVNNKENCVSNITRKSRKSTST